MKAKQIQAQRLANIGKRYPNLIGSHTLKYLFEVEEAAHKMKVVGDVLASLLSKSSAAEEWKEVSKTIDLFE
jgi:hypothetical protein